MGREVCARTSVSVVPDSPPPSQVPAASPGQVPSNEHGSVSAETFNGPVHHSPLLRGRNASQGDSWMLRFFIPHFHAHCRVTL